MKLSIIVPIYNIEEYIGRCALSLVHQTASKKDFEVIFVNDGTKDNSIERLKETVNFTVTPNFKIIEKKNGGLSSARNYGIDHSCGDYIWFVDSDDWIEPNSVDTILSNIISHPDILYTSQMFKNVGEEESYKYKKGYNVETSGLEVLKLIPASCAVMYIVRRDFLTNYGFRFKEGICFEDSELTPRMLYYADKVRSIDIPLYHHFMREGSITHNISEKSICDLIEVLKTHIDFYQFKVKKEDKTIYSSDITPKIITLLDYSRLSNGKYNVIVNSFFYSNPILGVMLRSSSHKPTRILGVLLAFFPRHVSLLFNILSKLKGRKTRKREC